MTDAVEKLAKAIVARSQRDPEMKVQPGEPEVYGVPGGGAFSVTPGTEVPLWSLYIASAREILDIAREIDKP